MAWNRTAVKTTKHTCNDGSGPVFGRKTAGCARCDELIGGAAPVEWTTAEDRERAKRHAEEDARWSASHFASDKHRSGGCGVVCTYGEW